MKRIRGKNIVPFFYNYQSKSDDSNRLTIILLVFAFLLCPPFAFFFKWVGAPESLFVSLISASIVFPFILLLERTIPFFKNRLPLLYFIFFNVVTIYSLIDLRNHAYEAYDFIYFLAIFSTLNFAIQRFRYSLIHFLFIGACLTLGDLFFPVETSANLTAYYTLFICVGLFFNIILYSRDRLINSLEDNNLYLKGIVNNMGHGVLLFQLKDKQIKLIDFNVELKSIFDEDQADQIERKFLKQLYSEDIIRLNSLEEEQFFLKELHLDNQKIVEVKFNRVNLKNGSYIIGMFRDITEKKVENERVRQNEKKYKNLFIRNLTGVFSLDLEGKILECNPAFLRLFNKEHKEEIQLFPDQKEWSDLREKLQNQERVINYRKTYLNEFDQEFFFVFNFYYDFEYDQIEGNLVDVTELTLSAQALESNERKYRSIYEESNDSILLLEGDLIADINQQGLNLFGKSREDILEKSLWDFSHAQSPKLKKYYDHYFLQLSQKKSIRFNWLFSKGEEFIEAVVSIVELKIGDEKCYHCVIRDETERNRNIRALENSKKTFESIIENTPEGFLILRKDQFLYASSEFYRLMGLPHGDPSKINFCEKYFGSGCHQFQAAIEKHRKDKKTRHSQLEVKVGENQLVLSLTLVTIMFEGAEATMMILKDISYQTKLSKEMIRSEILEESNKQLEKEIEERKQVELKLQTEYKRTRAIFDSSQNTLLVTLDPNLKFSGFNQQSKSYFDYHTGKEFQIGDDFESYFGEIISEIKMRYFRFMLSSVRKGKSHQFELKFINVHNEKVWVEIYLNPIMNLDNVLTEFSLVAHDITDKKNNEKEILLSLKEKEVLLKEVHHRVKNNLQIISSILNLQTSYIEDERILEIMEESRHRIRSMAIIHESLYQTTNFSSINFKNYARELVRNLISSYQFNRGLNIDLVEEVEHVDLSLDQAIPCGLIINELITNSMKYAFNEVGNGSIYLGLKSDKEMLELVVGDDGVGLPDDFDIEATETLGLQLVITLVEQLSGDIRLERKKGIKYFITFEKQKL
ncbi:MAG: PAS domain S-box protein [Bacteroidetes bacterium]|nr:MAG: PAS domain S-box protein [Bacteroidota bacterium]